MTDHASLLRQIRADARPYIEQWLEIGEVFAGFRKLAADNDLDWGVIKALIKAEVQDEQDEEGGSKRVARIIDKADCASAYADMLGLGSAEEKNNFSSSQDGVAVTRPVDVAGEGGAQVSPSSLPPHDEDGVLIEDVPRSIAQGDVIAPAPGAGGPTTATGDAGEEGGAERCLTLNDASPTIPQPVASFLPDLATIAPDPSPDVRSGAPISEMPDIPEFLRRTGT